MEARSLERVGEAWEVLGEGQAGGDQVREGAGEVWGGVGLHWCGVRGARVRAHAHALRQGLGRPRCIHDASEKMWGRCEVASAVSSGLQVGLSSSGRPSLPSLISDKLSHLSVSFTSHTSERPSRATAHLSLAFVHLMHAQASAPSAGAAAAPPAAAAAAAGASYVDIPHTQIRRVTAQRLLESKQTIPHYYLTVECQV